MTRGDLGGITLLGRPVKPLALAIAISTGTVFWFNLVLNSDILVASLAGDVVGIVGGVSCVLLFAAWWRSSQTLLELGLLLASGTWVARLFTVIFLQGFGFYGVYLSIAWTLACVSAYLLETWDDNDGLIAKVRGWK